MIVMKFGGTSVADSSGISRVIEIVRSRLDNKPVVVVSALSQVTNILTSICELSSSGDLTECNNLIEKLRERHLSICSELFGEDKERYLMAENEIDELLISLNKVLNATSFLREVSEKRQAWIISLGEQLSNILVHHAINHNGIKCNKIDARKFIITDDNHLNGKADLKLIAEKAPAEILKAFENYDTVLTQGFISSTKNGESSLLGREGSDLTATLIGNVIDAEYIEIWTDVDGIRSADPRIIENTKSISEMSFEVAEELSFFGAKVLHPLTIAPAKLKNIPVKVLNSKNTSLSGTIIIQKESISNKGIKSITSKENIVFIRIKSKNTITANDFLENIFRNLNKFQIITDIISISQTNIGFTLENKVKYENFCKNISGFSDIVIDDTKSQITIAGEDLKHIPGIIKSIFENLEHINFDLISGGSSDNNISFLVDSEKLNSVLKTLHTKLFL
ncbi:MAG: aspartate kinase [Saprospiraceae bacterium]